MYSRREWLIFCFSRPRSLAVIPLNCRYSLNESGITFILSILPVRREEYSEERMVELEPDTKNLTPFFRSNSFLSQRSHSGMFWISSRNMYFFPVGLFVSR